MIDQVVCSYDEFIKLSLKLIEKIDDDYDMLYAVPRGGLWLGSYISHITDIEYFGGSEAELYYLLNTSTRKIKLLIVDDLIDTGRTLNIFDKVIPKCKTNTIDFACLYNKMPQLKFDIFKNSLTIINNVLCADNMVTDKYIIFPWEHKFRNNID